MGDDQTTAEPQVILSPAQQRMARRRAKLAEGNTGTDRLAAISGIARGGPAPGTEGTSTPATDESKVNIVYASETTDSRVSELYAVATKEKALRESVASAKDSDKDTTAKTSIEPDVVDSASTSSTNDSKSVATVEWPAFPLSLQRPSLRTLVTLLLCALLLMSWTQAIQKDPSLDVAYWPTDITLPIFGTRFPFATLFLSHSLSFTVLSLMSRQSAGASPLAFLEPYAPSGLAPLLRYTGSGASLLDALYQDLYTLTVVVGLWLCFQSSSFVPASDDSSVKQEL